MDPIIGSAAISAGAGLVGSILGVSGQKQQYKYQRALMEQQYQNQIDFWHMNNEYNTPAAQMQRYTDAGVNPYVALGHGNTSQYGSVMQPTPQAPNYAGTVGAQIQQSLQNFLMLQQARNVGADTQLKAAQTKTQESITSLNSVKEFVLTLDGDLKQQLYDFRNIFNRIEIQNGFAEYNQRVALTNVQTRTYELLGAKINLTQAEYSRVMESIDLMRKEMKLKDAQIQMVLAQAFATRVQGQLNAANLPYADDNALHNSMYLQNRALSQQFDAEYKFKTLGARVEGQNAITKVLSSNADYIDDKNLVGLVTDVGNFIFGAAGAVSKFF